ncbi:hypothetical protein HHK36_022724 [Tetracentron sinense]|uniref:Bifunctional inhibitor/plant lipid transfer protein/seed storage helical domain-containing protein n=1 Tax=Tetracentron sinense TaxID=13715 RepID=A0A834YQ38_TETSI|nr:hypothetical protein HHK36_022724 [Tetracentron sinense]
MAPKGAEMVLVVVLTAMFLAGASAQSNCTGLIITLSPCLDYIKEGNSSTPSSGCCSPLATVVQSQPQCLCEVLTIDVNSLGLNINRTLALALPNACNIQTPSISLCNAVSPAGSPADSPPTVTSGGGSNTDPSDGSFVKLPYSLLFFLLFITSYASIFTSF